MVIPIFHADVTPDGARLVFDDREAPMRRRLLAAYAGQRVEVVVRKHRSKRSDRQNRWWWKIAVPLIANELGYDRHEHEDVHYALVAKCFGTHVDKLTGLEVPNARSSQLTTKQFSELMEWAVRWAAVEYGLELHLPGELE